jgi:hypothetical protein
LPPTPRGVRGDGTPIPSPVISNEVSALPVPFIEVYGDEPPSYTARACERRVLPRVPTHVRSNQ